MSWTLTAAMLQFGVLSGAEATTARVFYTRNDIEQQVSAQPVREGKPASRATQKPAATIRIDTTKRYQTMAGLGAAFSEIGTLGFLSLPLEEQQALLTSLFDVKNGAGFAMCRLPVGSSDFAKSAYSYAETPDDYEMKAFSLERDRKSLIPVVRAACVKNPALALFASPWSPPGWMKKTGKMDGGGDDKTNVLRDEESIYQAYALYFEKYLRGYQEAGIPIKRLCPQNELDFSAGYPGCVFEPGQLVKFVVHYLGPRFKASNVPTEIWPGTFREGIHKKTWAATCLEDKAFEALCGGLGVQYFMNDALAALTKAHPKMRLMFTEADCFDGKNLAHQAQTRFPEMINVFNAGCDAYSYWNMMLDETRRSGWGWKQNSLVTIDRLTHDVRYNADYQPVYLVSQWVRPGDVRVEAKFERAGESSYDTQVTAFVKPDGVVTLLVQSKEETVVPLELVVDGKPLRVELPAHADCVVVCEPAGVKRVVDLRPARPDRICLSADKLPADRKLRVPGLTTRIAKAYLLAYEAKKPLPLTDDAAGSQSITVPDGLPAAGKTPAVVVAELVGGPIATITDFMIPGLPVATIANHEILVNVPMATDLTRLAPVYQTGSPLVTGQPASGTTHDFTEPQTYTITAADGSTQAFVVKIKRVQGAVGLANPSFEIFRDGAMNEGEGDYGKAPDGAFWSFKQSNPTDECGISLITGPIAAGVGPVPDGSHYVAFIHGTGNGISQAVVFDQGSYEVSFDVVARRGTVGAPVVVSIDGKPLFTLEATKVMKDWNRYTSPGFVVESGPHTLAFNLGESNEGQDLIDNVQIKVTK